MNWHSLKIRFIAAIAVLYALIGIVSFFAFQIVTDKVVQKLGTKFAIKQALLEKANLDASIQRDLSLSLRLASSAILQRWVEHENDASYKKLATEELDNYRKSFGGESLFLAMNKSGHYYFSDGSGKHTFDRPQYTLSETNPNDGWYFRTIRDVSDFELNVDYDNHLDLTKIWFNVPIKNGSGKKIGICGSGIDLTSFIRDIIDSEEEGIETVLLDSDGSITGHHDRSYVVHNSKVRGNQKKVTIYDLLSSDKDRTKLRDAIQALANSRQEVATAYLDVGGRRYLAAMSYLKEINWFNLVLLDVDHVISSRTFFPILLISVAALLILIIAIGLLINRMVLVPLALMARSANDIARGNFDISTQLASQDEIGALSRSFDYMAKMVKDHTENLERKVRERTEALDTSNQELAESNGKLMDSIRYAQMIQASILPDTKEMRSRTQDFFFLYRPRDIVGGDFYYYRDCGESFIIAVADCTGHGVPGAFMSMTAKALIDRSIDALGCDSPADLMKELDRLMRETLNQGSNDTQFDNGLEIGLCVCIPGKKKLIFAGAGIDLAYTSGGHLTTIRGARQAIGYRRTKSNFVYPATPVAVEEGMSFFLASDGILDQSGGAKGWGFGKKRFQELLERISGLPSAEQLQEIETELADYQADLSQRDDITVLGFKL
jgi:serine phosphatase RsbU (regulator of sigma subunit)